MGGLEGPPSPPALGSAPAKPWRSSIRRSRADVFRLGHQPEGLGGRVPSGEEWCCRGQGEMAAGDLREESPEVGGDGEIAPVEELLALESGPAAVDFATSNVAPEGEHGGGVAVVGAAVAVLEHRAAELRHGEDHDVAHTVAEVLGEGGEGGAEIAQTVGELALLAALRDVRIPAFHVREGDLQTHVGADELGDLAHRLAEAAT